MTGFDALPSSAHPIIPEMSDFILLMGVDVMASDKDYEIERKPDGGYTIDLRINKRHWKPITAEGFFPKQEMYFKIEQGIITLLILCRLKERPGTSAMPGWTLSESYYI